MSLNSSILVQTYFPKTMFLLVNSAGSKVYSQTVVSVDNLVVKIQFPNGDSFSQGMYCLEVMIDEAQSNSCSISLDLKHKASVWASLDTLISSHSLQSVVRGAYLNNVDPASINCIYEHYSATGS